MIPPYSEEAERGVLGSALIDSDRVMDMLQTMSITEDSFYIPAHRLLFETLCEMHNASKRIDLLTVGEALKTSGRLPALGGYSFLEGLIDGTPTAAHAEYYAEIVVKKHKLRRIITQAAESIDKCQADKDPDEIIAEATSGLSGIEVRETVQSDDDIIRHHEEAMRGNPNCIPTPFESLTRRTGGVRRGMVTVMTGRSKSGKSMLKSFWIRQLAEQGYRGVDFCFEDRWEISKKRIASIGKYSISELDAGGRYVLDTSTGKFHWFPVFQNQIDEEREALAEVSKLPIWFFDKKITAKQLHSVIAKYKRQHDIQYAFIDGAKDMKRPSGKYNDCGFEEEVSQAMTEIAAEFDIALIAIHHLTKIEDKDLITPNSIRGSGNIVADSRCVYAVQGDRNGAGLDKYGDGQLLERDEEGYVTTRVLECIVNNHGQSGKVWMGTDLGKCNFWKV
jgi:replicative DNA helicase